MYTVYFLRTQYLLNGSDAKHDDQKAIVQWPSIANNNLLKSTATDPYRVINFLKILLNGTFIELITKLISNAS